ncbi:MAG: protein kinase, partial [Calditrichia bacterium]|nr:protein kinase [Calditrichia bacterium]
MIGKTISHYKILEELGRGGMGEVYLAEDLKLERKVAIKFLPQHLTKDKDNVERFEREAKAAASLNHPNIVTIHEIAEVDLPATADKQTFIVMEYVDGKSLREYVRTTQIESGFSTGSAAHSVNEIISIINQIVEGLSKAHQAGIVHRDIKPENILIDKDARVKILDFGLAKLKGVSKLTKESSTLGTVHYMSPEQIQGEDVDHRSDIWSMGVVLYEMLTGEPPFSGDYESAVHYAILNEEPKLYHQIETGYSSYLRNTVSKMIDKDRDKRYQDCSEIKYDLEKCFDIKQKEKRPFSKKLYLPAGIIITIILLIVSFLLFSPKKYEEESLKSLAVLPFINEREDPETDYLGMALADEIIHGLSYLQNIVIRPSSSVRVYKGKLTNPISTGQDLNADFILSGYHLKAGDVIRLNIELVDVPNNRILWGDQIEEQF